MKLAWQRFKFLGIAILALIIFIPLLVLGYGTPDTGYDVLKYATSIPVFHYVNDSYPSSTVYPIGACLKNDSGNDYFVPTRTLNEWTRFLAGTPSGVTPVACCGDGQCSGTENCSTCDSVDNDCGTCACQYIYSDWSSCDVGAANRTRTIIGYGPTNCTGTPEPLSVPCCSGCLPGNKCTNQIIYNNTSCSGNVLSSINQCTDNSTPLGCSFHAPVSVNLSSISGCTHECHTLMAGCPDGNSCRSASIYENSTSCSGTPTAIVSKTCQSNTLPNSTCLIYSPVGVVFSDDTGCSYYSE